MSVEFILGMAMVAAMLGTLLAKYITSVRTIRLHERLMEAESELRNLRGQLKSVENDRAISERNLSQLERKKDRLEKQIHNSKKELEALK